MEKELLEILLEYSLNNKIGDEFIEKIIATVVKYRKLEKFVNGIEYVNLSSILDNNITVGSYEVQAKKIDIDLSAVKDFLDICDNTIKKYSKKENQIIKGILVMQKVLHELEHAYQRKLTKDKKYNNKTEVKLLSCAFEADKDKEKYIKYYDFNPVERLAEDNSLITCLNTINIKQYDLNNVLSYLMKYRLNILFEIYKKIGDYNFSPTEYYLKNNYLKQVWEEFIFYNSDPKQLKDNVIDRYNFNQRLHLGLYLTKNEYDILVNNE